MRAASNVRFPATVNPPVSDVVAAYLREQKTLNIKRPNSVMLKGIADNPGIIGGG